MDANMWVPPARVSVGSRVKFFDSDIQASQMKQTINAKGSGTGGGGLDRQLYVTVIAVIFYFEVFGIAQLQALLYLF